MSNIYYEIGKAIENLLIKELAEHGIFCFRVSHSGHGYKPDIVCICNGKAFMLEVKYRSKETQIRFNKIRIQYLKKLQELTNTPVYIAIKLFKLDQFYFVKLDDVPHTIWGNYKIDLEDLKRIGIPFDRFILMVKS